MTLRPHRYAAFLNLLRSIPITLAISRRSTSIEIETDNLVEPNIQSLEVPVKDLELLLIELDYQLEELQPEKNVEAEAAGEK